MIPQKQLFRHDPENGVYGDCFRTAIACLLDLPPAEVPHLNADTGALDMAEQDKRMNAWLADRGLTQVTFCFPGETGLGDVLHALWTWNSGTRFMLSGQSRTGCNHVVIACDGGIEWDPSLTDAGIVGPCDDGLWWITYLGARV